MTGAGPKVSVIMATWGRGRHILPSVRSILQQDFRDFELIVAGDGCQDETEAVVAGISDPRLRWINLEQRMGSQSGPNNAGIAVANSDIIAYIGHDDIWEPSHLSQVLATFEADPAADFVVSGVISHLPNGIPGSFVRGLITRDSDKHRFFFPPCGLSHRKAVIDRIGPWRPQVELRARVDEDLLMRATAADLHFVSTGKITVHKFAAAFRYLSYVRHSSDEQEDMLRQFSLPDHPDRVQALIDAAKRLGTFMPNVPRDFDHLAPGALARANDIKRGISRPALRPLGKGAVIRHGREDCAMDWLARPVLGVKRRGRNPKPRLLLPFLAEGPVTLRFRAVHPERSALGPLILQCNGTRVEARPSGCRPGLLGWTATYQAEIRLLPNEASILAFDLAGAQLRKLGVGAASLGFGVGALTLFPSIR